MSQAGRFWPVAVVLLVALSLEVAPLPDALQIWRAPWVALALIFWSMRQPRASQSARLSRNLTTAASPGVISSFVSVSGVFFGWLIFDDVLTPTFYASLTLVGAGLILVNRRRG